MKLALKISLLAITGYFPVSVAAQVLPWPQDPYGDDYQVDSAYGPRNLGVDANGDPKAGTFFHKGIDLNGQNTSDSNGDINYPLLAPTYGAIFGIGKTTNGLKWIGIDYGNGRSLGYLHIFPDDNPDSKGNFVGVSSGSSMQSYRRIYTGELDPANEGVILFYSLPDNKGRIVKALGINGIHTDTQVKVPENAAGKDQQIVAVGTTTVDETIVVVDAGTDGVLNTLKQGDDVVVGNTITAGLNKIAESRAGYVTPQTSVIPGEIIAPLGKSGYQAAAHLHLQISSPDDPFLYNAKYPIDYKFNDGWNNVVQYLPRPHLTGTPYSGSIAFPAADSVVYHTADHNNNERIKAAIRWVPPGTTLAAYHNYELDRVKLFAIPANLVNDPSEVPGFVADDTYLINSGRDVQLTNANTLPNPNDPFRAEFNYGGAVGGYPVDVDNAFPPFLNNTNSKYRSDGIRTGLIAQGSLQANPVTEFVFNQWNTRINKNSFWAMAPGLAYRNQDAAYPDGWYGLLATAESVDRDPGEKFISQPIGVIIDNFRPYVERVTAIKSGGETVYERGWALSADGTTLVSEKPDTDGYLENGQSCDIMATFSEYMSEASLTGFPPEIGDNYAIRKTTLTTSITISNYSGDAVRTLEITGADVSGSGLLKIEPNRGTITPALETTRGADGAKQGEEGSDTFHSLRIEAGPPVVQYQYQNYGYTHSCGGTCGTQTEPINFNLNTVRFGYSDVGSGIANIKIYKDTIGAGLVREIPYDAHVYTQDIEIPFEDGLYVQVVTDNSGKQTTMWFRVDPVSPRLELGGVNLSPDFSTFTVYGVVQDTGSGMDFFRLTIGAAETLVKDFGVTPGATGLVDFVSPALNVISSGYYVFSAQDRAGNLSTPQPRVEFAKVPSAGYADIAPEQTNIVANYISKVSARGDPCTINITSQLNPFEIPVGYTLPNGGAFSTALSVAATELTDLSVTPQPLYGRITINIPEKNCSVVNGESVCTDACTVALEGYSILPLANGPKLAVTRSSSPTDGGILFRFGWSEVTFYDLVASPASKLTMEDVSSPDAPSNYVVYPPGGNRSLRVKFEGATYSGIKIKTCGFPGNSAAMKMIHYKDDGTSEDITQPSEGDCITGLSGTNSLFSIVAPISLYDQNGPVVILNSKYSYREPGVLYVSSASPVVLDARDMSSNMYALAGVASTYYLLDAEPTPGCLSTAYNPGAPHGTCENPLYVEPLLLPEGLHTLYHVAVDKIGNIGTPAIEQLRVDGTPPIAALQINGVEIAAGTTVYATVTDTITLSAFDPQSNGVASGLTTTYFLVDISTEECSYSDQIGGINGMGNCENHFYTGPFSLPVGEHVVYCFGEDNVGNLASVKTAFFNISAEQSALTIAPSSGPIGIPFTIDGTGFGTFSAGTTIVLIGGTTAPLTLWTDTQIKGTIPGTLAAGQYPVSVKRGAAVLAEVSPFTVTQPVLYALTPSSGAIGLPFAITGESFGNYVAGFTRVLLGGATMPLTLWTDTKIQGTIPGTLPVGDYELVVERALNGGVVRTSTTTFSLRDMEAYWLAPSSGPIGMPFTITGVGFGNYSSVYTHVLIGDTTAPLTLWTDTKIQGTVPGSLVSGQYPVLVERRTSDGGVMQTSPMTFEVVNVDVDSMTPVAGPIGLPFTIYGANFGNYVANFTRVLIGGTTAPLTLWTADKIQGTIPGALGPGSYPVIIERELNGGIVQSQALAFAVSTPTAFNMAPSSGPIGLPFTINGESFGNYSAAYTGVLINGATVPLTLWTDTQIKGTIPGNLTPGQYPVIVGRMTADGGMVGSNALTFEVLGVNVASMTPVAGPIGLPFTIYGAGFGNYSTGYTKVLIGGTMCPLTLWTDTKIQGTIPGSLAAGEYPVVVERSLNGGQVQSVPVAFTVAVPEAYSFSPSSGPIGLPFTIMGANFGNYVANYTKVLIGGAAAPLTLWTDTKIQGTIPGSLADVDHEVVVERALNGGVVHTSTFTFTVGAPYLDTVSPSTASVIAPFTITGYNFGNYVANYTKVLINGTTTPLTLWTDTKIQGKLPFLLAGTYPVQVQRYLNGGLAESATAYINIEDPVISSMTPTSGAVGTVFNLYGTGFGPYDATIAKVFLGGTQCALSLWTDTKITGTVPSGLSYGTHTVVAMRGQAVSNGLEYYIPGGYSPSMMRPGTGPSALEFKLGEVYVYPDPAKGGKVPTFHIEVGTADSVKLKVYTVAGQLAHETDLTGSPQAVGSVYAYEYPWMGRIASGVYYYTVEAERAGKKLKAKGKFSVVR